MRPLIIAPTDMNANLFLGHITQGVIENFDVGLRNVEEFFVGHCRKQHMAGERKIRTIKLKIETTTNNRLIFRLHRIGEG